MEMIKFRLSNNIDWSVEFDVASEAAFNKIFPSMLKKCAGRLVSLHRWGSPCFTDQGWFNVGNVQMGVFYEGRSGEKRIIDCKPGRIEVRGNGFRFLSVSPSKPMSSLVWKLAVHGGGIDLHKPRNVPEQDVRDLYPSSLKKMRERLALTQSEFAAKLKVSEKTIRNWESGAKKPGLKAQRKLCDLNI